MIFSTLLSKVGRKKVKHTSKRRQKMNINTFFLCLKTGRRNQNCSQNSLTDTRE